jgi:TrmH family RNA methyltransferase
MIDPEITANIEIILVDPLYSGNIGQTARAMANNGLSRLGLVNPPDYLNEEARKMALGAIDILRNAPVYKSLSGARTKNQFVVGTSKRLGQKRIPYYYTPRAAAPLILQKARQNRVALVFGNESSGLSNEDLDYCHEVIHIPAHPDFSSYNLAQAILIVVYELFFLQDVKYELPPDLKLAPFEMTEPMFRQMQDVLLEIEYIYPDNPSLIMRSLRRLLGRNGMEERDVRILRGILAQMQWVLKDRDRWRKKAEEPGA